MVVDIGFLVSRLQDNWITNSALYHIIFIGGKNEKVKSTYMVNCGIVELCNQPLSNAELFLPAKPKLRIETGIGNIFTLATFPHPQQWTILLSRNYIIPQFHNNNGGIDSQLLL